MTDQEVFASEQAYSDKQADLQRAKEALAGPVPLIGVAPDPILILPRGLFDKGTWQREVEVRELTGADEEALAKTKDQVNFFSTVIALGTVRIGDTDLSALSLTQRRYHLGQLLIGEREQVFLKIVQVSFGDEKVITFTCPGCQADNETTLVLSEDFPPHEVENVDLVLLHYSTAKGDTLDYRPAVGDDQEEALSKKGASVAEQNTLLLSRCITKVNGQMVVDPVNFARNLGMRDRQQLLEKLVARQPSISLDISPPCSGCGTEVRLSLSWGDIFRP
jgi:hypothetical protein